MRCLSSCKPADGSVLVALLAHLPGKDACQYMSEVYLMYLRL